MSTKEVMQETKSKITKANLIEFNNIFSQVKVKGLEQQPCIEYLTLKVKISEEIEKIEKSRTDGVQTVLKELGYKDGDKIPAEKQQEVNSKLNAVIDKLLKEEVDIQTNVLSVDDFFNSILNIEENKDINTEGKATLMKYLVRL